jgi:hypothetical protein
MSMLTTGLVEVADSTKAIHRQTLPIEGLRGQNHPVLYYGGAESNSKAADQESGRSMHFDCHKGRV